MTTNTEPDATTRTESPSLARLVSSAIHRLQSQVTGDNATRSGSARASVATMRNAAGYAPADRIRAWMLLLEEILPEMPTAWLQSDAASHQEQAAFVAVTNWALHQQASSRPMHRASRRRVENLGFAVGDLSRGRDSASIKTRFDALLLSPGDASVRHHLRSIIQLLRTDGIPLDYGRLAQDLYELQLPHGRRRVLLRWGRGFAVGSTRRSPDHETASAS